MPHSYPKKNPTTFHDAIKIVRNTVNFNPEIFLEILHNCAFDINVPQFHHESKTTLLIEATKSHNISAVSVLLENGADPRVTGEAHGKDTSVLSVLLQKPMGVIDPTKTVEIIMNLLLDKASWGELDPSSSLINGKAAPIVFMSMVHGAPIAAVQADAERTAVKELKEALKKGSEILKVRDLHPSTLAVLNISEQELNGLCVSALKSGAAPWVLPHTGVFTKYTEAALATIIEDLRNSSKVEAIKEYLYMSLDPQTHAVLESRGVDFHLLAQNAVDYVLAHEISPGIKEGSHLTKHALEIMEIVETRLLENPSLLLYSNLHSETFKYFGTQSDFDGSQATDQMKKGAIAQLKEGVSPTAPGQEVPTKHAKELLEAIAQEALQDHKAWLDIQSLDPKSVEIINEVLQARGSSIELLETQIQKELKEGMDLLGENTDIPIGYLNKHKAIDTLISAIKEDPTLLFRIKLADNTKGHLQGEGFDLARRAVDAIERIINNDDILPHSGDFAKCTEMVFNILMKDPRKILYVRDHNIEKIFMDLEPSQVMDLKNAAKSSVKAQGAPSKIENHLQTKLAYELFTQLVEEIKVENSAAADFTQAGILAVGGFVGDDTTHKKIIEDFRHKISTQPVAVPTAGDGYISPIAATLYSWFIGSGSGSPKSADLPPPPPTSASSVKSANVPDITSADLQGDAENFEEDIFQLEEAGNERALTGEVAALTKSQSEVDG